MTSVPFTLDTSTTQVIGLILAPAGVEEASPAAICLPRVGLTPGVGVGAPGVGVAPGVNTPTNRGGPANRAGRR